MRLIKKYVVNKNALISAELEALRKELKDTEDLYIRANRENEKLRLQIEKLTGKKNDIEDCESA